MHQDNLGASRLTQMVLPLLSLDEVISGVMGPVLHCPVKEKYGFIGQSPAMSHKDVLETEESLMREQSGRGRTVQPGEECVQECVIYV